MGRQMASTGQPAPAVTAVTGEDDGVTALCRFADGLCEVSPGISII
jgi:hypothetical protein